MQKNTTTEYELALLLERLEQLLDRVEDHLQEAAQVPLIADTHRWSKPFISDEHPAPADLFSQPGFHITTPD